MKKIGNMVLIFIIILSACSPGGSGFQCSEGICIDIEFESPVNSLDPVVFVVKVKTDKDIIGLGISISSDPNSTIHSIDLNTPEAELRYQAEDLVSFRINSKGGITYTYSGLLVLEKSSMAYGISGYRLIAAASLPSGFRVNDSYRLYLDSEGNQLEEGEAKLLMETDLPLPTLPPDVTVLPDTPFPTIIWPTDTPLPTLTPTSTATPAASQTLPPYP